jgi:hypothetical protein
LFKGASFEVLHDPSMTAFMVFYGEGVGEEMKFSVIFPQQINHEKTRNLEVSFLKTMTQAFFSPTAKTTGVLLSTACTLAIIERDARSVFHRIINGTLLIFGYSSCFVLCEK